MHVALLCATGRGYRFLERLRALHAGELTVFSFREEPREPPFLDDIRSLARDTGAAFHEARNVGADSVRGFWESAEVDLLLCVSWRYMVPAEIYRRPTRGAFVIHDSLLPEYRGFSPTVWAMINGEERTGATLFEMVDAVDAGDIVDQEAVPIGPDDVIADVMEGVTDAYLRLLERNLEALLEGSAPRRPQDHARATYTCKRLPEDNRIDWTRPAGRIHDLIRACGRPYPGAFTFLDGRRLRVWAARRLDDPPRYAGAVPGRVAEVRSGEGSVVLTGDGPLLLTEVQWEDADRACAASVLNRLSLTLGRGAPTA